MNAALLGYAAITVAAAASAGMIAVVRRPGERATSGLQHFAAGVVFAAAAIELIPRVLPHRLASIAGFVVGIAVMFGLRAATERLEARPTRLEAGLPTGLIAATAIDFLVDGGVLGAGFRAGGKTGILLTIALSVEYLFVGLSLSATLGPGVRPRVALLLPPALAVLTVVGAEIGDITLANSGPERLAGVLAFGAVAFMYLVTEELLVKAHERGETAAGSVAYFLGFLLYMVLRETIG